MLELTIREDLDQIVLTAKSVLFLTQNSADAAVRPHTDCITCTCIELLCLRPHRAEALSDAFV